MRTLIRVQQSKWCLISGQMWQISKRWSAYLLSSNQRLFCVLRNICFAVSGREHGGSSPSYLRRTCLLNDSATRFLPASEWSEWSGGRPVLRWVFLLDPLRGQPVDEVALR